MTAGRAAAADPPLDLRPRPPVALYVHIPFCVSACPYCDFVVYAGAAARGPRERLSAFVEALMAELELRADVLDAAFGRPGMTGRPPLRSVYLGGGTPSLLEPRDLQRLLGSVARRFGLSEDAEVTLEANPGPAERGDLEGFRRAGVDRLSVGAQTFDPAQLRRLGRRHRPDDVAATVRLARRAGFASVSIDLLYDLPGQTLAEWDQALEAALRLPIDHLSAYALTLEDREGEGAGAPEADRLPVRPGAGAWRVRARAEQDESRAAAMYELADRRLASAGFAWYEISNWARPGHQSRHNLTYWRREPYEALGPGAHAFDGARHRRWNAARLDGYLAALAAGRLPPGGEEQLDDRAAQAERSILALRLATGIEPEGRAVRGSELRAALAWGRDNGLTSADAEGRWRLTLRGRLLSNELFARLV